MTTSTAFASTTCEHITSSAPYSDMCMACDHRRGVGGGKMMRHNMSARRYSATLAWSIVHCSSSTTLERPRACGNCHSHAARPVVGWMRRAIMMMHRCSSTRNEGVAVHELRTRRHLSFSFLCRFCRRRQKFSWCHDALKFRAVQSVFTVPVARKMESWSCRHGANPC